MRIAATGFVSDEAGSVASANAELLRALLETGHEIDFFSKPSFVDPRPSARGLPGLRLVDCTNRRADALRRILHRIPLAGFLAARMDSATYHRRLGQRMREAHAKRPYDVCLWLGDYARASCAPIPTVSFVQGPPGTDARSLLRRRPEIARLAGPVTALRWSALARLRLSAAGRPPFPHSDHFIVGSSWSAEFLSRNYGIPAGRISILPYPIDLTTFIPAPSAPGATLRVLWLGRIVPRKRLDLFLDGSARAIAEGCPVHLTIVGGASWIPAYEKLLTTFPYPERLTHLPHIPRSAVPALLRAHDLLAQPSEEENFGSSVAEAQACGLPVLVGATNGTGDYVCARSRRLPDDSPAAFANALHEFARRRDAGSWGRAAVSRAAAEHHFSTGHVAIALERILRETARLSPPCTSA